MHPRKLHHCHEIVTGTKGDLVLSRKTHDDVGGHGQIGDGGASGLYQPGELRCGDAATHPVQGLVAASLQRQVELSAQARVLPQSEEGFIQVPRLQ